MALSLKVSNSLERLAESFSADLLRSPGDVFKPDFIITQTQGMNNWLKVQMAYRNGIAANMRFVKPNDILYQVYFRLEGPREQVLAADNLQWVLFTALEDPRFKQRYPRIAGYYKGGDEIKRLGLAQKIADLFDQYQIYRPEMISEWNENSTQDSSLDWQAFLWIDVREKLGAEMPDKTALAEYITTALDDPARVQLLKERLPRVSLFGISILTAFHIDLFYRLSSHIDIRFYLLNPSPHLYWYQDRSSRQLARWNSMPRHTDFASPEIGNTLLTNWGRVIQDTFGLLFHHEEFLNRYDDEEVIPPVPDTLLKKIQFDIFQNAVGEDRQQISVADLMDGSISFNACYTPAREVEVLYNYLVRLVETGKLTTPRDVVVMVNDINTYAPYIRAVFGAAPYHFPYIIADEYLTASQGFFSALQAIMNLEEEDFKAENVLQLLEFNLIRERFQLTRTDLIHQAVREANIRFGIQGSAEDESVTLSWENGLKRIMYGICMTGTGEYTDDGYGFYPLEIAEGEQALDLVRFTHFAEVLIEVTGSRKNPRSLLEWSKYLEDSVERLLISSPDQEDADYMLFQEYLERLKVLSETMKEQISFKVFRQSFVNQMASETRPGNFIGGGITFCSLIPMRSIPFETVAILGLDFDKFPRKEKPVTFDLIKSHPRPGDRNVRENDKHLFLETLLSAGERLYISYIGKNVRDNSSLPPSALVDELLDYITENPTDLIQVHPLHGFSTKYAGDDKRLYTYLGGGGPATEIAGVNQEPQPADFSEIDMGAFINFFKNPIKAYYNKVLDIYYQEDPLLVGDTEVFELNALERWSLKQDLLFLPDDALGDYRDRAVKLGQLPLRHMGDLAIDSTSEEIEDVRKLVRDCIGEDQGTSAYVGIELNGGSMVTGNLAPIYGNRLVRVSFSKNECKYCLEAYLLHLFSVAGGLDLETHYISANTVEEIVIAPADISKEEASETLNILLDYYRLGHTQPLAYSLDFKIAMGDLAALTPEEFMKQLDKAFGAWGWISDAYLIREYQNGLFDDETTFEAYREYTTQIYGPVYEKFKR